MDSKKNIKLEISTLKQTEVIHKKKNKFYWLNYLINTKKYRN